MDYYLVSNNVLARKVQILEVQPALSYLVLSAGSLALYFGMSKMQQVLFSKKNQLRHAIFAISLAVSTALVVFSFRGSDTVFASIFVAGTYFFSWLSIAFSYIVLSDYYAAFGTKGRSLPLFSAFSSVLNPVLFFLAILLFVDNGVVDLKPFYALRMAASVICFAGGIVASIPSFILLRDLMRDEREKQEISSKAFRSLFLHNYASKFSAIFGQVAWTIYASALSKRTTPDYEIERLSDKEAKDLILSVLESYKGISGPISYSFARDLLKDSSAFQKDPAIRSAVSSFLKTDPKFG